MARRPVDVYYKSLGRPAKRVVVSLVIEYQIPHSKLKDILLVLQNEIITVYCVELPACSGVWCGMPIRATAEPQLAQQKGQLHV